MRSFFTINIEREGYVTQGWNRYKSESYLILLIEMADADIKKANLEIGSEMNFDLHNQMS